MDVHSDEGSDRPSGCDTVRLFLIFGDVACAMRAKDETHALVEWKQIFQRYDAPGGGVKTEFPDKECLHFFGLRTDIPEPR